MSSKKHTSKRKQDDLSPSIKIRKPKKLQLDKKNKISNLFQIEFTPETYERILGDYRNIRVHSNDCVPNTFKLLGIIDEETAIKLANQNRDGFYEYQIYEILNNYVKERSFNKYKIDTLIQEETSSLKIESMLKDNHVTQILFRRPFPHSGHSTTVLKYKNQLHILDPQEKIYCIGIEKINEYITHHGFNSYVIFYVRENTEEEMDSKKTNTKKYTYRRQNRRNTKRRNTKRKNTNRRNRK